MTEKHDPFALPEWFTDAWQSAINNSRYTSDEVLLTEVSEMLNEGKHEAGSWSRWNTASYLAVLGWREVLKYRESQSQADRGEGSDLTPGE